MELGDEQGQDGERSEELAEEESVEETLLANCTWAQESEWERDVSREYSEEGSHDDESKVGGLEVGVEEGSDDGAIWE